MSRRVVVTGLGVAASNGTGIETFWDALMHGRSGVGPITHFDASALRSRIAGEVTDLDADEVLGTKLTKRSARCSHLGLVAANEALAHAGLSGNSGAEKIRDQAAIVLGTGIGAFDRIESEHDAFREKGPERFYPLTVPVVIPNAPAGWVAIETGCRGPNLCVSTACATGVTALGTALDLIRNGRADVAIAGATESTISPFAVAGYCMLRALSTRNDDPTRASRPFSKDRDGFVIAEGAGVLILEELEHAKRRGATIYAELAGYGASSDAHHITAPDPESRGAISAMRAALADARVAPGEIDLVNAHGTSTPLNDPAETAAIKAVLGDHAYKVPVQSTKSMTGHALGGASAIESVAVVLEIARGSIHPTINLDEPDPDCDLDYVPHEAREMRPRTVLKNAFGFGGHNGVLVFRRWDG